MSSKNTGPVASGGFHWKGEELPERARQYVPLLTQRVRVVFADSGAIVTGNFVDMSRLAIKLLPDGQAVTQLYAWD